MQSLSLSSAARQSRTDRVRSGRRRETRLNALLSSGIRSELEKVIKTFCDRESGSVSQIRVKAQLARQSIARLQGRGQSNCLIIRNGALSLQRISRAHLTAAATSSSTARGALSLQQRLTRQFLYKRETEARERAIWERKQAVKDALASGKKPSGDGKASETDPTASLDMALDDEYANAGLEDPKILITTSRGPSSKLGQFAKEIRLCLPNSHRVNRGQYTMQELADAARANGFTDLVVLHEHRGVPDALVLSHFPHGPTVLFTLHNVALRHDLPGELAKSTVSEQYPHLIFENFSSSLGQRIKSCLRFIFPVPREDSKRVMTFANERDFIAFRHHVYVQTSHKEIQLAEVGPRFEMRRTIDNTNADVEWVLRPYMRSARRNKQL